MKTSSLSQETKHNLLQKAQRIIDQIYPQAEARHDEEMYSFRGEALKQLKQLRDTAWTLEEETSLREFIKSLREIESERDKQVTKITKEAVSNENWIGSNVRLGKKAAFKVEANITDKSITNKYYLQSEGSVNKNNNEKTTENEKKKGLLQWLLPCLAIPLMISAILYQLYTWLFPFFRRNNLNEILKHRYQQSDFAQLKRLFSDDYSSLNSSFINLALITYQAYQEEKESHLNADEENDEQSTTLQNERLYQTKKPLDLRDIFIATTGEQSLPHHVLVEGGAGMGKTTLCRYLVYQWALGEDSELPDLAKRFTAVIWLPLQALVETIKTYYDSPKGLSTHQLIAEYIYQQAFFEPWQRNYKVEEITAWLETLEQTGQLLYIFDGYDEIASWVSEPLWQNFFEKLWLKPNWLLTTRPYSFSMRHAQNSRHLELLGFVDEDIPSYVQHFFVDEDKRYAAELIAKLKDNSSLWNAAHIPINLELLCIIWQENAPGSREQLFTAHHVTLTSLYEQLLRFLVSRFIQKHALELTLLERLNPVSPLLGELEQQYPGMPALLAVLEKLAWRGVDQDGHIFQARDYKPLLADVFRFGEYWERTTGEALGNIILQQIGLLRPVGRRNELALGQNYEFLHPTFREFLAARYLAKRVLTHSSIPVWEGEMIKPQYETLTTFLCERRYEPRYLLLLSFTAGLLKIEGDFKKDYAGLNDFLNALMQPKQKDLIGWYDLTLQLRCLEECGVPSQEILPVGEAIKENLRRWLKKLLNKEDKRAFEQRISELRMELNNQLKTTFLTTRTIVVPWLLQLIENKKKEINLVILVNELFIFCDIFFQEQLEVEEVARIVSTLLDLLPQITNGWTRGIILSILAELSAPKAAPIMPVLSDSLPQATYEGILAQLDTEEPALIVLDFQNIAQIGDKLVAAAMARMVSLLDLLLQTTDQWIRRVIKNTLIQLGTVRPTFIVPYLLDLLPQITNEWMSRIVTDTLVQLGTAEPALIMPFLLDLLPQATDGWTHYIIARTLRQLDAAEATRIMPALLDLLPQITNVWTRDAILDTLIQVGAVEAASIIPALLDLLSQITDWETRHTILCTVAQLDAAEAARIVPILLDLLPQTTDGWPQPRDTLRIVTQIGKIEAARIVPLLLDFLQQTTNEQNFFSLCKTIFDLLDELRGPHYTDTINLLIANICQLYLSDTDEDIRDDIIHWLIESGSRLQDDNRLATIFSEFFIQTKKTRNQVKIVRYIIDTHLAKKDKSMLMAFLKPQQAQQLLILDNEYDRWDFNIILYSTKSILIGLSTLLLLEIYQQEPHPAYLSLVMRKCLYEKQALSVVEQEDYLEIRIYGHSKQASSYRINKVYANHFVEARNSIPLLSETFIGTDWKSNALTLAPIEDTISQVIAVTSENDSSYHFEDAEAICPTSGFENNFHIRKLLDFEEPDVATSAANQPTPHWLPSYLISNLQWGYQQFVNLLPNCTGSSPKITNQHLPQAMLIEQLYLTHYFIEHLKQSQFWPLISNKLQRLLQILPYYRLHNLSIKECDSLQISLKAVVKIINQIKHHQTTRVGMSPIYREELLPLLINAVELVKAITMLQKNGWASSDEIAQIIKKTAKLQSTMNQYDMKKLNKKIRYIEIKQERLGRHSQKTGQTSTATLLLSLQKHTKEKWIVREQTLDEKLDAIWLDKPLSPADADKVAIRANVARAELMHDQLRRANLNDHLPSNISNITMGQK